MRGHRANAITVMELTFSSGLSCARVAPVSNGTCIYRGYILLPLCPGFLFRSASVDAARLPQEDSSRSCDFWNHTNNHAHSSRRHHVLHGDWLLSFRYRSTRYAFGIATVIPPSIGRTPNHGVTAAIYGISTENELFTCVTSSKEGAWQDVSVHAS